MLDEAALIAAREGLLAPAASGLPRLPPSNPWQRHMHWFFLSSIFPLRFSSTYNSLKKGGVFSVPFSSLAGDKVFLAGGLVPGISFAGAGLLL